MNMHVLVVEQNPLLCDRFVTAFSSSGFTVKVTDRASEAIALIEEPDQPGRHFDLVVVDMSDGRYRGFVADVIKTRAQLPVFLLKDAADKSLVIDLLNEKQIAFLERYVAAYAQA